MSLKSKFGAETCRARNRLGLTQEQLAEAVSVTPRSIQYIEKGAWMPKSTTMLRLMYRLKIPAETFADELVRPETEE